MKRIFLWWVPVFVVVAFFGVSSAGERVKLTPDTPDTEIISMNPAEVDPSLLPLDPIENLNVTGTPPENFDLAGWRLGVSGKQVGNPLSFSYEELSNLPMVEKKVLLICPGFFADYAEWEGVPLRVLLERAQVEEYQRIRLVGLDGYETVFTREELEGEKLDLLFLALRVNGETLPPEHGFPVRLVAEDFYGSRWVRWLKEIVVE
ncbi:MAG: molybdopterin-dependent oxidoreductase [Candidatus Atribacteria bacterium]|nr:molybdopterin-dependent oxidoreductase [Candidatus Atribacteria bacterium]